MIFKTIKDETTLSGQRIISTLQARKIAQKEVNDSIQKHILQLELDKTALINLENKIASGMSYAKAYTQTMTQASITAKEYALQTKGLSGTTDTFVAKQKLVQSELESTAKSTKLASVGVKVLSSTFNIFTGIAITWGITKIIEGFNYLSQSSERAKDRLFKLQTQLSDNNSSYENNRKTLVGLREEYDFLTKKSESLGGIQNLPDKEYQKYQEIMSQILDITPKLITGWNNEGAAISNKNNLLQHSIELLDEEYEKSLRNNTTKFKNQEVASGVITKINEFENSADTKTKSGTIYDLVWKNLRLYANEAVAKKEFMYTYKNSGLTKQIDVADVAYALNEFVYGDSLYEATELNTAYGWLGSLQERITSSEEKLRQFIDSLSNYENPIYNWFTDEQIDNLIHDSDAYIQENQRIIDDREAIYQDYKDQLNWNAQATKNNKGSNAYNQLSENAKSFIHEYIEGLDYASIKSEDTFVEMANNVQKFTNLLASNEDVSRIIENVYALPKQDETSGQYVKRVKGAITNIQKYCKENDFDLSINFKSLDDVNRMHQSVKSLLQEDFYNEVEKLTFEELQIATEQIEIPEGTLLSLDELIAKIREIQNSDTSSSLLSLPDAFKAVNGSKEGDTEVIGLIDELSLLQEILSDTGSIQESTYEKLFSCSSKYSTAVKSENGHITVNTTKLKQAAQARRSDVREAIRQTLALKKQEWVQWNNGIDNYNGSLLENIETTYGSIDALQEQITQLELLSNSVDEASNAFRRFEAAKEFNDQDMFDTAQDAYNLVNETLNNTESEHYGKTNTKGFQAGIEFMASEEDYKKLLNAKDMEEYASIAREVVKKAAPFFDETNGLNNLFQSADKIVLDGDIPKNDKEWSDRLGISSDMFQALKQRANLYEYNNREFFSSSFTNTLDEYQSLLSNVMTAQEALNNCTDITGSEYMKLSQELDTAKQKYNEFKNSTTDTVWNAHEDYIDSDAESKEPFDEYLKHTLDFDDSDIDGVTDILLDKASSIKMNLENMHPDSAAYELYKNQLEEVHTLLSSLGFDADSMNDERSLDDRISRYMELIEKVKECKETMKTSAKDSDDYHEAEQELERISLLMTNLKEPLMLEITSNITEIDSQLAQLDEELNSLKESLKQASSSNEIYAIHRDITGHEKEKANLEDQKENLQQLPEILVDSAEVDEKTQYTLVFNPDFSPVFAADVPILEGTIKYRPTILDILENPRNPKKQPQKPKTKTDTETKKSTEANGTFNAFALGSGSSVSIPRNEKALVNELGEEGLVRNGRLIPIRGGAQFINLKRGDIIFNHKQMDQLKKNGYTSGRGKLIGAHAKGTVYDAFNGTNTNTKFHGGSVLPGPVGNSAVQTNSANNSANDSQTASDAAEETLETFEKIFDWIEYRLKNFQRKFDKWLKQAETALTKKFVDIYYKKASKNLKKELSTYGKSYGKYMKEANALGLDEKYAKKIRNGTLDIETIRAQGSPDDMKIYQDLADKIQKYQEWYDKAAQSTASFVETAEKLYHLPLDKAADKIEIFSDKIDLLDKKLKNAIGSQAKNTLIKKQDKQEKKTLVAQKEAKKETKKNLKQAKKNLKSKNTLSSPDVSGKDKKKIKNAVKNNKQINLSLFEEGSKAYNAAVKYNEALKARKQAVNDCSAAQEEYNSWAVESNKLKFDNIADDFEKQAQLLDHQMTALDSRISEIEASGAKVNISYYESQKKINDQMLATYQQEKNELEKRIGAIKPGTDEWYEAFDQIQQVSASISSCKKETYELNNAINQLHFDLFEDISKSIGRIITEQEFLQSLFAHEKLTDDKTGNLTEAGLAKLGSLSASYYASDNDAQRYAAEVKELRRMYNSGSLHSDLLGITLNSMDDLKKVLDETVTKEQDSYKERYDFETKINDMMKERYQAELNYLKELIDDKKNALNAEKDLHDYNRTISEKTNDISTLQKQIAAYSGDTSQEGLAKLQKLQKELSEKEDDLHETEYDRYISDQQDMLDKLYEEYQELTTKKMDDFMLLVGEGLDTANANMAVISDYLTKIAEENNYIKETDGMFDRLAGTIQDNINNIIADIADDSKKSSGTSSSGEGAAVANSASPGALPPAGTPDSGKSATSKLDKAKNYIAKHASSTKKKKKEFSDVNQVIYENKAGAYSGKGKILSPTELQGLAKELNVTYNGGGKDENLYKKLKSIKFPGFQKGGIVSVDSIEKQVKSNGDDGIASVKNGEGLIPAEQMPQFLELLKNLPNLQNVPQSLVNTPDANHFISALHNNTPAKSIAATYNFTLENCANAEDIIHQIKHSQKVQKALRSVTSDRISGSGRLSVKSIQENSI